MDRILRVFVGGESIYSPMGKGIAENFSAAKKGQSGLQKIMNPFPGIPSLFAAKFDEKVFPPETSMELTSLACIQDSLSQIHTQDFKGDRWLFILSTTKGAVHFLKSGDRNQYLPQTLLQKLQEKLPFKSKSIVVSNACISGLSAMILAADYLAAGKVDHALVLGADELSEFTAMGFNSFFALDEDACRPFDKNRKGLNLGEGAASIVLSTNLDIFIEKPIRYLSGASSNDANHISGPSRTGEGLVRAVQKSLTLAGKSAKEIQFISAHGTGTLYNDEMEAKAFRRLDMNHIPVNSLKGYFGHTLGASSLIEIGMTMQSMRLGVLLKSQGFSESGTEAELHVLGENQEEKVDLVMKTASGFGGCNAAVLLSTE